MLLGTRGFAHGFSGWTATVPGRDWSFGKQSDLLGLPQCLRMQPPFLPGATLPWIAEHRSSEKAGKAGLHSASHLQGPTEMKVPFARPMCSLSRSWGTPSWRWESGVPGSFGTWSVTNHLSHECLKPNQ